MIRILVFIGLKIAVISILILPYFLSKFLYHYDWWCEFFMLNNETPKVFFWMTGTIAILFPLAIIGFSIFIIAVNWNWAKRITN